MNLEKNRAAWEALLAQRERLIGRTLAIRSGLRCEVVTIKNVRADGDKVIFTVEMNVRRGRGTGREEYDIAVDTTAATPPQFSVGRVAFTFSLGEVQIDC